MRNASEKLVDEGYAVKTQDQPKKFGIKPPTDGSAA
ncbi:hypothetical protein BJ970_004972 [Saccharopolyspora phatthalungensis]|uniref:Uncharacterized protein n=1 Tax=Saccharopolyspora phatthalungensis TaxID=664693 RepID=A0A840QFE6_9PSEU|nr:hypothetical protein [Saccharopolyspora phatthalungensis]